jgi:hypothetical protein
MAKVKDNIVTEGLSGKLGKRLVARHMRDGRTIIATRPNYTGHKWTPGQSSHHSRFKRASAYASLASKTNPIYAVLAAGTAKNAYNLALSDWFKPPVIHQITQEAGSILVHATDNVQVTEVRVTISDEHGKMLEQGKAVPLEKGAWWEYASTTGGRVHVEAFDPAGNIARLDL